MPSGPVSCDVEAGVGLQGPEGEQELTGQPS